jgi:hypothetical protein
VTGYDPDTDPADGGHTADAYAPVGSAVGRAARLAEVMTADHLANDPAVPAWTVQDVLDIALANGLDALEKRYLPGK